MKVPSVCCLIASGFEEIEALAPVDILRRAGSTVTLATIENKLKVKGRNGIEVVADAFLSEVPSLSKEGKPQFDMLIIPGGPGISRLREDGRAKQLAAVYVREGAWVAAICSGPIVLSDAGLLEHCQFTAHFSVAKELPHTLSAKEPVVVDNRIITSRGAGTAIDFGLTLVLLLMGVQKKEEISHCIMGTK